MNPVKMPPRSVSAPFCRQLQSEEILCVLVYRRDTCRFLACENMHTNGDGVHTPCVLHVVSEGKTTPNSGTGAIQYGSQIAVLIEDAHRGCVGKGCLLCVTCSLVPPPAKDFWDARCFLPNRIAAVLLGCPLNARHCATKFPQLESVCALAQVLQSFQLESVCALAQVQSSSWRGRVIGRKATSRISLWSLACLAALGSRPAASQLPACPVLSVGPPRCHCPGAPAAPP